MKHLRHLIRRYRSQSSAKRVRRPESQNRRLNTETLERRELLAADMGIAELASHNSWNQYDVNNDRAVSARDALGVINYLGRGESEQASAAGNRMYYDVNGDNQITAADALSVINAIGRGEGETDQLVELLLTARTYDGDPGEESDGFDLDLIGPESMVTTDNIGQTIRTVPNANQAIEVNVGEIFELEVSYEDLRTFPNRLGAFQLITNIVADQQGFLQPVLFETQQLIVDQALRDVPIDDRDGTSITLTIPESPEGRTGDLTYTSTWAQFSGNAPIQIRTALAAFGYLPTDYELTIPEGVDPDDIAIQIHWTDIAFADVDLPDISIEVNEVSGAADISAIEIAFDPIIMVGSETQFNPEAIPFNLNTKSRSFDGNKKFYTANNDGDFDPATGFTAVKGIGGVPSQGGGIPQLLNELEYPAGPFDAYSLPVKIVQPVTGLQISVQPNADDGDQTEAILIYGEDNRIPITNDTVVIEGPTDTDMMQNGKATIIINAIGDNDPPVVSQPITVTYNEDQTTQTIDLLQFASDPDGDTMAIESISTNGTDPNGAVTRTGTVLSVDPTAYGDLNTGESQVITATYTISDGRGGVSESTTATITITGVTDVVNNDPTVSAPVTATFTEDQGNQSVDLLQFSNDADGDTLTVTNFVVTNDPSGAVVQNGTSASVSTGNYGTLNDGENQVIGVTYTLNDGNGGTVNQTATITITGVTDVTNSAPTVSAPVTATFTEDQGSQSVNLLQFSNDADGDTLTVTNFVVTNDPSGAVVQNGTSASVSTGNYGALNDGENQVIGVTYTLDDGNGGTVNQTGTITITGVTDFVNTPPVAPALTRSFNEGAATATVNLLDNASDVDAGQTLSVTNLVRRSGNAVGITAGTSTLSVDPSDYSFLLPGQSAVIIYDYRVSDGTDSVATSATITINGAVDDPPTTGTVAAVTVPKNGGAISIDVLSVASAGGGETQTLSIVSASLANPAAGTLATNGTLTFTPATGFEGSTTINYVITDGTTNANGSVALSVVNFVPSTIGGAVFIDRIENMPDVINGATPLRNGMKDANEQGIGGQPMKLVGNGMEFTAYTDATGEYEFQNVAPGTYQIVYAKPTNVIYNGPTTMSITIGAAGGVTNGNLNVPLLGLTPGATSAIDILARTYLNSNGSIAAISNNGREGAIVSLENGQSNFFMAGEGFEGVRYADVRTVSGSDTDIALLTVLTESGDVMSTMVPREHAIASPDGSTMRFFGGLDDFTFQQNGQNVTSYDDFQSAIDQILSGN